MKKFEYKFVKNEAKLGFKMEKKIEDAQHEWNELGKDGWQFCKEGINYTIFMREITE